MLISFRDRIRSILSRMAVFILLGHAGASAKPVDFSREILPILSDRCFHCHGPDKSHRKAKLRLDLEAEAKKDRDGFFAVFPGDPEESELWLRIISDDEDEVMPPPDSHRKPLSADEKETFKRWLKEGAPWGKHWSFQEPVRPEVPDAAKHPVDAFVRKRLADSPLEPSPRAKPHVLARRLSFDLTGLPPAPEDVARLTKNNTDKAWAEYTSKLLASSHHGERMAMWWLDAARYSDTDGYQQDAERTNWPWRDWVVDAFNRNLPFDRFTIEQIAGDLLPKATKEQILATAFHRNHMTNGEGGRHPEESRIDYVIDRVNTTGTVWMGLTLGCVQCHSHKFDPISHEDYYRMFAFFNSVDEDGKAGKGAKPYLKYRSKAAARSLKEATDWVNHCRPIESAERAKAGKRFETWLTKTRESLPQNYRAWRVAKPSAIRSVEGSTFAIEPDGTVQAKGPDPRQDDYHVDYLAPKDLSRVTGWKLEVFPHESHTDGRLSRGTGGRFTLTNVKVLVRRKGSSQVREVEMASAVADLESGPGRYGKVKDTLDDDPRNGWGADSKEAPRKRTAVFSFRKPLVLAPDETVTFVLLHRSTHGKANIGRFRISMTDQAGETVRGLKQAPLEALAGVKEVSPDLRKRLLAQFLLDDADYQSAKSLLDQANRQLGEVKRSASDVSVMVMAERKAPRKTHILERGVWDAKGAEVKTGYLSEIHDPEGSARANRLDMARWLVSSEHPLTARVIVNHLWQLMFGAGLVRTPGDFGLQGELPTHPELLDWLAVELMENDWNLRHILNLIVTSETYRQASEISSAHREQDPDNRLLARAPRFRLPAWMLRDQALAVSGLINPALGGPPVKPWQPVGVWNEIFMGRFTYRPSVGPAQYRRTLYAYWRRSSAPTFLFDSAQRRVCEVNVRRTNTPLHALVLLNDINMLEASRALADQFLKADDPVGMMSRRVLFRDLDQEERKAIEAVWKKNLALFEKSPDDALKLITVGQQTPPSRDLAPKTAALMTVASVFLNLDETITHE